MLLVKNRNFRRVIQGTWIARDLRRRLKVPLVGSVCDRLCRAAGVRLRIIANRYSFLLHLISEHSDVPSPIFDFFFGRFDAKIVKAEEESHIEMKSDELHNLQEVVMTPSQKPQDTSDSKRMMCIS
jgi:hypothetical protein